MYETQIKKLREYGLNEESIDIAVAILSEESIETATIAYGKIGGGAGYDQVVSLFFYKLLSQEDYIQESIREMSGEQLTEQQIRESMSDIRGSYGVKLRLDEEIGLILDERIRLEKKLELFKHRLLQREFSFKIT